MAEARGLPHDGRVTRRQRNSGWLALVVAVVFGQSLAFGFVWDDLLLIAGNTHLSGPGAFTRALTSEFWDSSVTQYGIAGYWRPVPKLSHALLTALGGGALPFHLLNVVLHLAACLLAMEWLRRRLSSEGFSAELSEAGALAGALLFAVHPSRFETVGWVSCSAELFFACFTLSGLLLVDHPRWKWLGFGAFALAMSSKETAVLLPVLLLVDALWARRLKERAGVIAGTAAALATVIVVRAALKIGLPTLTDPAAFMQRVARSLAAFASYHQRTLVPTEATLIASEVEQLDYGLFELPATWIAAGAALALGWVTLGLVSLKRPAWRPWVGDFLWWLLLLAPVLQLVAVRNPTLVSDRYLYLPLLGPCAAVARLTALVPTRAVKLATTGVLLAFAMLVLLALPSLRDNLGLFAREYTLHPDDSITIDAYTRELAAAGQTRRRAAVLEQVMARRTDPRRIATFTLALAEAKAATLRDSQRDELASLSAFFEALPTSAPPTELRVGAEAWPTPPPERIRKYLQGSYGEGVELTMIDLRARTGKLEAAASLAAKRRARVPSTANALVLARTLAIAERWSDAAAVLAPLGPNPLAPLVAQGAASSGVGDELQRVMLLNQLGAPGRAREVLAPLVTTRGLETAVFRARVQTELTDHDFDAARALVEEALRAQPGDPEFLTAQAAVEAQAAAWSSQLEEELAE